MKEGMLPCCDFVVIASLQFQDVQRPLCVTCYKRSIRPGVGNLLACQGLYSGAKNPDVVDGSQMLPWIEFAHIPIGFVSRLAEVDQGSQQRQIPGQLGGGPGTQPFALPVATVAPPIDRADRTDDDDFSNRPRSC